VQLPQHLQLLQHFSESDNKRNFERNQKFSKGRARLILHSMYRREQTFENFQVAMATTANGEELLLEP